MLLFQKTVHLVALAFVNAHLHAHKLQGQGSIHS